jgi:hypothetical protein
VRRNAAASRSAHRPFLAHDGVEQLYQVQVSRGAGVRGGAPALLVAQRGSAPRPSSSAAILRMVPAHAREIDGRDGWRVGTAELPNSVTLNVTSADSRQATVIRGLGFIGVLAIGSHNQAHHLAIARGDFHGH